MEPGDLGGLKQALNCIAKNPGELWAKRRNAFAAGHRHYDTGIVAQTWMKLFEELKDAVPAMDEIVQQESLK